ncbi:unnamed protein product [Orchesella dallaii]|uniref:Helicase C-terminal domain-containing protein n=1 Tax=Orchesella dallaii TaxID=48710 RepID=A0ABP1RNQ0_9HEXA
MMVFQQYSGKLLKIQALTGRDGYSYTNYQVFLIGRKVLQFKKNTELQSLLDEIKENLSISVANSTFEMDLTNTSGIFDQSFNQKFGEKNIDYTLRHPKLTILKNLVQQHFLENSIRSDTTRVMIFSQYRDSVQEMGNLLNSLRPMVKPIVFIGQSTADTTGKGLKQKEQDQVVQRFRDGGFNVLVSTCVGEEGLDIDRFLVTRGKDEEKYRKSLSQQKRFVQPLSGLVMDSLYLHDILIYF